MGLLNEITAAGKAANDDARRAFEKRRLERFYKDLSVFSGIIPDFDEKMLKIHPDGYYVYLDDDNADGLETGSLFRFRLDTSVSYMDPSMAALRECPLGCDALILHKLCPSYYTDRDFQLQKLAEAFLAPMEPKYNANLRAHLERCPMRVPPCPTCGHVNPRPL